MTISIGGITLNAESDVIWSDRFASQSVERSNRRTLGGRMVSWVGALIGGLPITLEATDSFGWLHKSEVDALLELAAIPGGVYTLVYGAESYEVTFDHSSPPAIDMRPNVGRVAHGANDYFTGQIKLLTV